MDSLISLVESFKKEEHVLFGEYYSLSVNKKKRKRLELLNLILKNEHISNEEACEILYGKDKDTAFIHLKKGLREDLLSMLSMLPVTSFVRLPVNVAVAECRRMIGQAHYLNSRDNRPESIKLLKKAAKLAEKYEHYGELLIIYNILITRTSSKLKMSEYNKLAQKRLMFLELEGKVERARNLEMQLLLPSEHQYRLDDEYLHGVKGYLDELTRLYKGCDSSRVAYHYFRGRLNYNQLINDINESRATAAEMTEYLKDNCVLNSKSNLGGLQLLMASFSLILKEYDKASEHAKAAYQYFSKSFTNQVRALELVFMSSFRLGDYEDASIATKTAFNHKHLTVKRLNREKWQFYDAGLQFRLGNLDKAMQILNRHTRLKEDRSGWYLGIRILDLVCQLEAGNYDIYEIRLNAFRRLLSSVKSKISVRDQKIYEAFRALLKNKFDFTVTVENNIALFSDLHHGTNGAGWDPMGYELVKIDEWVLEKSKSKIFA